MRKRDAVGGLNWGRIEGGSEIDLMSIGENSSGMGGMVPTTHEQECPVLGLDLKILVLIAQLSED